MMGYRQVDQAALFYELSLEKHIPADHLLRSIDRFVDLEQVGGSGAAQGHALSLSQPLQPSGAVNCGRAGPAEDRTADQRACDPDQNVPATRKARRWKRRYPGRGASAKASCGANDERPRHAAAIRRFWPSAPGVKSRNEHQPATSALPPEVGTRVGIANLFAEPNKPADKSLNRCAREGPRHRRADRCIDFQMIYASIRLRRCRDQASFSSA
jgi:hypothetical protein